MRNSLIILILFVFSVPAYGAAVYKWVDEKGVVNFTDEYNKVPPIFRNGVETREYLEKEPPSTTLIKEEVKTDMHSRAYWKKQLDEATTNYEKAREELLKEGERLVSHRYGSETQYDPIRNVY